MEVFMNKKLPERVEKLQARIMKGSKKIEFNTTSPDLIVTLDHFLSIKNPTAEQKSAFLYAVQSGILHINAADQRNRLLLETCQRIHRFHYSRIYKEMGLTWDDACKAVFGITKQAAQPYEEIWQNIPLGLAEELVNQGAALGDLHMLAKEIGREEGAEIEFLDGGKELVVKGQRYSLEQGAVEAARAAYEFAYELKEELGRERRVRKGNESYIEKREAEIAELKETLERKKEKIRVGEKDLTKAERRQAGFQPETDTELGRLVVELVYLAGRITQTEVLEGDNPFLLRFIDLVDLQVYEKILNYLRPHLPQDEEDF
jgi:hypothetical protein